MTDTVILSGARTPIGKMSGALASFSATRLGGFAIEAALSRGTVEGDDVDFVFMGQVVQAGAGQVPARQAAHDAGIPLSVPGNTVNKACLSGLNAIQLAHRMVALGEAEIVVAGGMESMTNAPYLLPKARGGYRYGDATLHDSLTTDGLFCAFDACLMGASTERYSATGELDRLTQDEFAAASHERAARATKDGDLAEEIVPIEVPQRRGDPVLVTEDEGIRPGTSVESLNELRPAFADSGNITAGNASQLSDGAAAVVVTSRATAERLGVAPLAEIVSFGEVAGPDPSLLSQPSRATSAALDRAGLTTSDVDLFEFNEAFAAVAVQSMRDLSLTHDVVNPNGGAIALGHPIGMSGTRLALTLAHELRRRGGGVGAAALCGGGGQGDALIMRVPG
jgi:acetyl-CoA C-acetyltransferase